MEQGRWRAYRALVPATGDWHATRSIAAPKFRPCGAVDMDASAPPRRVTAPARMPANEKECTHAQSHSRGLYAGRVRRIDRRLRAEDRSGGRDERRQSALGESQ